MLEFYVEESGERIDRYLADQLPDLSRSRIQKLIELGHVQVNGELCKSKKVEVEDGDLIQIELPEVQPLELKPEAIPLEVLYEDDSLIIINKSAGMVVHPSAGHESGTLVNALLAHCETLPGINGVQRPGIVHRLDKDTTGAIFAAKTEQAFHHLQEQFRTKTARRDYYAIVYGAPKEERGTIDQPIGRHPVDRQKQAIVPEEKGGRRAITHWQVKERLGNYTLLQFELETGRTHQIRVHSAFIGHPVVGDPVYSSGRSIGVNLPGQALHAWRLRLIHPLTEEWIEAIAPVPAYFTKLLEVLRKRS
ncbi:RluA family pseudouridine synthase [Pseudanabaenaceae cyanobacterium LEGE 13415]|nr:RluA family pseudouridine synthase [Pseudanabaenaceae cyanobacterium LEGE 13415]